LASPLGITAGLAFLPRVIHLPGPAGSIPLSSLLIIAVQTLGVLLARELELPIWRRVWLLALASTALLLPLTALQAAASRVPFVSLARGSAGPLIWSSVAVVVAVLALVALVAFVSADLPEQAALLFTPAAVLVPALLGAPGNLNERSALTALAEASSVAAAVAFVGWLLPRGAQPLVAASALGVQFVVLWTLGYDPSFAADRGGVVPILATVVLVCTVVAAVLVPLTALVGRGLLRAARDAAEPTELGPTQRQPPGRR
jgi:hypothetical protein